MLDQPDQDVADPEEGALTQRLSELEQRVVELEWELTATRAGARPRVSLRGKVRPLLLLGATGLSAIIPSLLVFQDRWLGDPSTSKLTHDVWCQVRPLCQLALPPYFALIIPCALALLVLVIVQSRRAPGLSGAAPTSAPAEGATPSLGVGQGPRPEPSSRGRRASRVLIFGAAAALLLMGAHVAISRALPGWGFALGLLAWWAGWFLNEAPLTRVTTELKRNWEWALASLLAVAALIVALAGAFTALAFPWVAAILLALSLANLARYRARVPLEVWLVLLATFLYSLNTNAWWQSGLGDAYGFFLAARDVAERSLGSIGPLLFNGKGVYDAYPYLASIIQAAFMKLLGINGFSWRFSNAFMSALAVGFFFTFLKKLMPRRTALVAALLLAASQYIMSFGKIGFSNLQALFAMTVALWAAAWAVRSGRPLAFVTLGMALALCFYVFPAALYVLPLPVLLLLLFLPPNRRPAVGRWALMALTCLICLYPLFFQASYWTVKITGTFLPSPQLEDNGGNLLSHFAANLAYALFAFAYAPIESHFVVASHVDPLTGALVWIGLALCLLRLLQRDRLAVFALGSFAILIILVGVSHNRLYPPTTRMFLLLPLYAVFAAEGLIWLVDRVEELGVVRVRAGSIIAMVIVAVIGLNLYQAYTLSRERSIALQSWETYLLRTMQRAQQKEPDSVKDYVFISDPSWTSYGLQQLPSVYPLRVQFNDVTVQEPSLPEPARELIKKRDALVIMKPGMDPAWQDAIAPVLRELGKEPCPINTPTGDPRFTLWHAPDLGWLCE